MKVVVFTPTNRPGGLDVNRASLLSQHHDDLTWIIGDDLYNQREAVRYAEPLKAIHFNTALNKANAPSSLAFAYKQAIEMARERDADLFVTMQDYMWIPPDGIARFERMADAFPTSLLTGLCSLSNDPYPREVVDPDGHFSIFAEAYDGHKPTDIGWEDCRLERWEPKKIVNAGDPIWWETNWGAIPRHILHDTRLNFDDAYNRGYAYENQDYAIRATQLGYGVWIDTGNHAIGLPHKAYFPEQQKQLESINNREWHESRHRITAYDPAGF